MRLVGWLLRLIVITIVVNLIWRLIAALWSASTRQSNPRRRVNERPGGALVRDPQCGTYVMQSRALSSGTGHHLHYFCSDACRTAYLAAHPQ